MKKKSTIKTICFTTFAIILALIFIFPFYSMVMMSTHYTESLAKGLPLLPGGYLIENLRSVFAIDFHLYYKNSLIVSISATFLSVVVSGLAGYAFAKYKFKGSNILFSFILITMMIPTQMGLIAFVIEMKALGWMNTLLPLIIPAAATGFGVYWLRSYISSAFPNELMESGRIDGAGELLILFRIAVPCIKPALLSLALMNFIANWNSYLIPLIVLNRNETYTIPIGILNLNSMYRNDLAAKITALTLGVLPLLILFLIMSKSFIKGLTMGAVKG